MTNFVSKSAVAVALVALFAASAYAQGQAPAGEGPPVLANKIAPAKGGSSRLLVTSGAFVSGGDLDDKFTQNGDNMSPGITWSKGPQGTQSYVVLAEDSGVNRAEPIVHWVIYNIPSTATSLPQNVPTDATLENGASQGKNIRGTAGYIGPKPPAGQTHPYHFQVFAINGRLNIDPATADRNTVVNAMKNRVLASGDLVANYTGK
ncbi:MAG TPA: YbhB/YbcL family Raf kinase inhibitor-like protein [Micropepsaceae bacterium]|jgi:Raf kinase inhibitor-like YbhB/YbcL family protein|nr:YbhB/YbcL family Raf kinase inhibitor-like protein [Micropepsaceae bacterium]